MAAKRITLTEAARLTGLSEKALRRRAERGVLETAVERRRRYVTIAELRRAGLLKADEPAGRVGEILTRLDQLNAEMAELTAELRVELG